MFLHWFVVEDYKWTREENELPSLCVACVQAYVIVRLINPPLRGLPPPFHSSRERGYDTKGKKGKAEGVGCCLTPFLCPLIPASRVGLVDGDSGVFVPIPGPVLIMVNGNGGGALLVTHCW